MNKRLRNLIDTVPYKEMDRIMTSRGFAKEEFFKKFNREVIADEYQQWLDSTGKELVYNKADTYDDNIDTDDFIFEIATYMMDEFLKWHNSLSREI